MSPIKGNPEDAPNATIHLMKQGIVMPRQATQAQYKTIFVMEPKNWGLKNKMFSDLQKKLQKSPTSNQTKNSCNLKDLKH